MAENFSADRYHSVLKSLSTIPEKMLSSYTQDTVVESVLRDISQEDCFNFKKSAFLVENPDFHCCKGVAGYDHIRDTFNTDVISINRPHNAQEHLSLFGDIAQELGFGPYNLHRFSLRHNNIGVLLYEAQNSAENLELIPKGACLLGLCPIF